MIVLFQRLVMIIEQVLGPLQCLPLRWLASHKTFAYFGLLANSRFAFDKFSNWNSVKADANPSIETDHPVQRPPRLLRKINRFQPS